MEKVRMNNINFKIISYTATIKYLLILVVTLFDYLKQIKLLICNDSETFVKNFNKNKSILHLNNFSFAIFIFICFAPINIFASDSLTFNAYIDSYYATDNDTNESNRKLLSILNPAKESINLNVVLFTANYKSESMRAKLAFHFGDMPNVAWQTKLNFIQEAYIGFKLSDKLWFDVGNYLTHIGIESVNPKDNWLSTLSLLAQNEPFYQAGAKLTYEPNTDLKMQIHLLNGYNLFEDNNRNKSLGYTIAYQLKDNLKLSLNGIIGNEDYLGLIHPDYKFSQGNKILNSFLIEWDCSNSFKLKGLFDISSQEVDVTNVNKERSKGNSNILAAFVAAKYLFSESFSLNSRIEMYNTYLKTAETFNSKALGYTIGLEYKPRTNSYIRLENRLMNYSDETNSIKPFKSRNEVICGIGLYF